MTEDTIIIAVSTETDKDVVVGGSTKGKCDECGHEIWLAPSSQIMLKVLNKPRVLCIPCGRKAIAEDDNPTFSTTLEKAFEIVTKEE